MLIRKVPSAAAALSLLGLAAPMGASAAATPVASAQPAAPSPRFTFVPPRVGPISVMIGATVIGGKVISPGLNVSTSGTSLPPFTWTPPASPTNP